MKYNRPEVYTLGYAATLIETIALKPPMRLFERYQLLSAAYDLDE